MFNGQEVKDLQNKVCILEGRIDKLISDIHDVLENHQGVIKEIMNHLNLSVEYKKIIARDYPWGEDKIKTVPILNKVKPIKKEKKVIKKITKSKKK